MLANRPPTAPVVSAPALLQAGQLAAFVASATDPDGSTVRFEWDFDASDGIQVQARGPSVATTYATMGTRTVTVKAIDFHGLSATSTVEVAVDDALRLTLALLEADPERVGLTERPLLRLVVRDDAGSPVAGASLRIEVRHETGIVTAGLDATTDAAGVALVRLPNDSGTTPGVNVPGRHVVAANASAPSREGAPMDDVESTTAALAYVVAP